MKALAALLLVSTLSTPLFAWGEKGHMITNEAATFGASNEMPPFFHKNYARLVYLSYDPDRMRGAGPSLEAANPPEHFLDFEYVEPLKLTNNRYEYLHELETSGTLRKYGISNSTPGFLPWKISEMCEQLTAQWRLWRATTDRTERAHIEANIINISGLLGHYVGDASNPHHTTMQYNGWVTENPEQYPNDCETHYRFESMFVATNMTTALVVPQLKPLKPRGTDYFNVALDLVKESNGLVETIYRIDRDRGFQGKGTDEGKEFAISRLAAGASVLRDLWYSCYINSLQPPPKRGASS